MKLSCFNLLIVILFLFSCCQSKKEGNGVVVKNITSKRIFHNVVFADPLKLFSYKNCIIVRNTSRTNPMFETYNENGVLLNKFGYKGKGPGEIGFPTSVFFSTDKSKLFLHDNMRKSIFSINSENLLKDSVIIEKFSDLPMGFFGKSMGVNNKGTFILQGANKKGFRFTMFKPNEDFHAFFGDYPEKLVQGKINGISSFKKALESQGQIICGGNNNFATIIFKTDFFQIWNADNKNVIKSSNINYPLIKEFRSNAINSPAKIIHDKTICGYSDITTDNDLIYCLFTKKKLKKNMKDYIHSDEIHVFDWKGEMVNVLKLDTHIYSFTVMNEGKTILGFKNNPEPCLYKFIVK